MSRRLLLATGLSLSLACGAPSERAASADTRVQASALLAVPDAGVACIQVTVTGARTSAVQSFEVAPGSSTVALALRGIPTGSVLVSGAAYAVPCGQVTPATAPTWITDATTATVPEAGAPVAVDLTFRRNGMIDLRGDFVSDEYQTSTIAGLAGAQGGADGVAAAARFQGPNALALVGGALFVVDRNFGDAGLLGLTIRKVTLATGQVETIAGSDTSVGTLDGEGRAARFQHARAVVPYGTDLLVADRCAIRRVGTVPPYAVTTLYGEVVNGAFACRLMGPALDIAVHGTDLYILDTFSGAIWRGSLAAATFTPTVLAGLPGVVGANDGTLATARFGMLMGIVFPSPASDVFYVSDATYTPAGDAQWAVLRRVSPSEDRVTTIAGAPQNVAQPLSVDGVGTRALFNSARRLVSDGRSLFTGDEFAIRRVDLATHAVLTIAGGNTFGSADGLGKAATFHAPFGLALAPDGSLYAADQGNFTIRRLAP